ncbi:TPA: diversity-generating retroelement protein bAvd family protein [Candidatus Uhrbacteria bacterium]|nr:diversity-generating retroelement protein bAvd family protein [Candidatus Uhrbacteria bacterium]
MSYRYQDLRVEKQIRLFIGIVYRITTTFPQSEQFGLTSQLRRAAVSILLNLAEGSARRSKKDFARFITISMGSLLEVNAGFEIAQDLNFVRANEAGTIYQEVTSIWKQLAALRTTQE